MIPTMILLGLVLGRWWRIALVTAAIGWPALLLATNTIDVGQIVPTAMLGLVNAAVGVLIVQGVLRILRDLRHRTP